MEDEVLLSLLSLNPALRQRIEGILRVAGNFQENIELADTAEEQLIEESRHLNAESDGSMIPIVETYVPEELSGETDQRKYKRLFWKKVA